MHAKSAKGQKMKQDKKKKQNRQELSAGGFSCKNVDNTTGETTKNKKRGDARQGMELVQQSRRRTSG
ncbi:unnamed protein product, partial [Amoebophrya sp. A25]|eukprot:GSA25T00027499001.1